MKKKRTTTATGVLIDLSAQFNASTFVYVFECGSNNIAQKLGVMIESQQSAHREMQKMMNQKDKTSEENERQKS